MRSGDEKLDPVPVRGLDGGVVAVVVVLDTTGGDADLFWLVSRSDSCWLLPVGLCVVLVCSSSLLTAAASCCGPKDPPPRSLFWGELLVSVSPSSNDFEGIL